MLTLTNEIKILAFDGGNKVPAEAINTSMQFQLRSQQTRGAKLLLGFTVARSSSQARDRVRGSSLQSPRPVIMI